jgi:hypothetical protein
MPVQAVEIDLRHDGLGRLDHFVLVSSGDHGRVSGLVVLYGLLGFVVNLGVVHGMPSIARAYRVCQVPADEDEASDRLDDPTDLAIPMPNFAQVAERTYEEFRELAVNALETLMPEVLSVQRRLHLQWIVAPILDRAMARCASADGELSAGEQRALASELAAAVVDEFEPIIEAAVEARITQARLELKGAPEPPETSGEQ